MGVVQNGNFVRDLQGLLPNEAFQAMHTPRHEGDGISRLGGEPWSGEADIGDGMTELGFVRGDQFGDLADECRFLPYKFTIEGG